MLCGEGPRLCLVGGGCAGKARRPGFQAKSHREAQEDFHLPLRVRQAADEGLALWLPGRSSSESTPPHGPVDGQTDTGRSLPTKSGGAALKQDRPFSLSLLPVTRRGGGPVCAVGGR